MKKCSQCGDEESILNRFDVCLGCVAKAASYKAPAEPESNSMSSDRRKAVIRMIQAGGSARGIASELGIPTIEVIRLRRSIEEVGIA